MKVKYLNLRCIFGYRLRIYYGMCVSMGYTIIKSSPLDK